MNKISLDYLAATIDMEGCISIAKNIDKRYKNAINYHIALTIGSTTIEFIELLHEEYGGGINYRNYENKNWKNAAVVVWYGKKCKDVLELVKDKLIIKKQQAELILQFPRFENQFDECYNNKEFIEFRELIYNMVKLLNKRGK